MVARRSFRATRSVALGALLLLVLPAIGGRRRGPAPAAAFRRIARAPGRLRS